MLLLTDRPEAMHAVAPEIARWSGGQPSDLLPVDGALWRGMAAEQPVWMAEISAPEGTAWWSRVVLIDHASSSQFDALRDLFRHQAPLAGPVACLALTGQSFHGHRQRRWVAEPGNLHLSVAIPTQLDAPLVVAGLTMLPAVATVDAVRAVTGGVVEPRIKWVNDVLIAGCKIAGVLTASQTRQRTVESVVFGIGLNVARSPDLVPTPFVPRAGCLADGAASEPPGLGELFWALLGALAARFGVLASQGPGELLEAYRRHSLIIGEAVRIYEESIGELGVDAPWSPPLARGVVVAIEPDLSLRLDGVAEPVSKGRLALERICQDMGL